MAGRNKPGPKKGKFIIPIEMRCGRPKVNGKKCAAAKVRGMDWCQAHNPVLRQSEDERIMNKLLPGAAPVMPLNDMKDLLVLVADSMTRVRTEHMDTKVANAVGFLADKFIKAYALMSGVKSFCR